MMGTVLSLVDLVHEGDSSFLGYDSPIDIISGNSGDSNNCGSGDSRGC